jgi:hypothetical protein
LRTSTWTIDPGRAGPAGAPRRPRQFTTDERDADGRYVWGYRKPTRFWGSEDLRGLAHRVCDGVTCANLRDEPVRAGQRRRHLVLLGSNAARTQRMNRDQKYRVPRGVIEYVAQLRAPAGGD